MDVTNGFALAFHVAAAVALVEHQGSPQPRSTSRRHEGSPIFHDPRRVSIGARCLTLLPVR